MAVPIIHSLDIFIDYLLYSGPLEGSGYSLVKKKEKRKENEIMKATRTMVLKSRSRDG